MQCSRHMNGEPAESSSLSLRKGWIARVAQLQEELIAWPSDELARCELAETLEKLERYGEALANWKVVLDSDPNSIRAREGVIRCRYGIWRPSSPSNPTSGLRG